MPTLHQVLLGSFAIAGLVAFVAYGYDKLKAKVGGNRVSEKLLLMLSFLGPLGAVLGVFAFNHKSSKLSYKLKLIPILIVSVGIWGWSFYQVFWKN